MSALGAVAVRVDAGPDIGIGHMRRCATLARRLRQDGLEVLFVCGPRSEGSAPDGCRLVRLPECADEAADAEATLSAVGGRLPAGSWVVVDHYGLSERWERRLRQAGHRVLAIDDYRDRRHDADILVSEADIPFDGAAGARQLVGARFALIDPDYAYSGPRTPGSSRELLICYGGSDPTGETAKALEALRLLKERALRVHVVIGPANRQRDRLLAMAQAEGAQAHVAPTTLAPLLREADLFLSAGGNSMVEAVAMRKPCLVTRTARNQELITRQLEGKGGIILLGDHDRLGPPEIAAAIEDALSRLEGLRRAAEASAIFDHLGAGRIAEAMR